jgi:hypothetical protein
VADFIGFELDAEDVSRALAGFPDVAQRHLSAVARRTAERIAAEAKRRLSRQLGPNATGRTEAGIGVYADEQSNPLVFQVVSVRPLQGDEEHSKFAVPRFIEAGTKKRKKGSHDSPERPFFAVSAELEQAAYLRAIGDALNDAANESGLGG